ncbi:unnamed protein product [Brassica rapa]|uniref:Uncharacterized protein n=2 Tax=Brassica campestris TaxID=3711 RepID=M4FES1_BRACM|nr:unnamed protein product [Brassica rapa]
MEDDEKSPTSSAPLSSSPKSADLNQWCSYHKSKAYDTRNCRHMVDPLFSSNKRGTPDIELPKPRQNNAKTWSKKKERKAQSPQDKAAQTSARPKRAEDDKPDEQEEGEACADDDQPRNRRRVQVIFA